MTDNQFDPIFVILYELSRVDGKSIWIGNNTGGGEFHPGKTEPGMPCNEGKVKRALSTLESLNKKNGKK